MCTELNIECTNIQPRKKRGPKNRYVQALRAQLDGDASAGGNTERHSLDLVAPYPILQTIISDWFNWIHPVAPIFHGGVFSQRLAESHSAGTCSTSFLLLVVSVCAATVASLPRRSHLYGEITVEKCVALAEELQLWNPRATFTLERTLTIYNLSSAMHHESGMDAALVHRLVAECAISLKYLVHHELENMSFFDQQILKRVFWLAYAGQCTLDMHGRPLVILRQPYDHIHALIPREVTDEQLIGGSDTSQQEGVPLSRCYIAGLNALSSLFRVWQSSQAVPTQTMENLQEHIVRSQEALANLPPELTWHEVPSQTNDFAFDVQKVNLKITQLHVRSNLLEQMNTIAKNECFRFTPDAIIDERHRVVDELLETLYRVPKEVFDANGYSIVPKIRDIGSALLDELRTGSHGRTLQASISLDKLLAKLEELDIRHA